jgi:broad specificity phosphatase PhoE
MPRLYLIRHALPKPRTPDDRDPPLDPKGRRQADDMAKRFEPPGPLPVLTSPLMRCRMTAAPLAARWEGVPRIVEALREVPAPGQESAGRGRYLDGLLQSRWPEVLAGSGAALRPWRDGLMAVLEGIEEDAVIVSHYIAINVVVGVATGSDAVSCFKPGHASVTVIDRKAGRFTLHRLGAEAATRLTSG